MRPKRINEPIKLAAAKITDPVRARMIKLTVAIPNWSASIVGRMFGEGDISLDWNRFLAMAALPIAAANQMNSVGYMVRP